MTARQDEFEIVTRREPPADFKRALARLQDYVTIVMQFAEV